MQGGAIASKNITINIETWMVSTLMNFQLDLEAGKVDSLEKEPDHVGIFPSVDIVHFAIVKVLTRVSVCPYIGLDTSYL